MVEGLQISLQSSEPLYIQIREQLRQLIMGGMLEQGVLLPSLRELAVQLSCSLITVRRVYLDLEHDGLITIKRGVGTYVCYEQDHTSKERSKKMIYDAFREVTEVGRRYQFSPEDMKNILQEVLTSNC